LIPAALDCLTSIDEALGKAWAQKVEACREASGDGDERIDYFDCADTDIGSELYEELCAVIDGRLPAYLYWGSTDGDGADIGVWVSHDSIADDRRSGELPSGDQLPDEADAVADGITQFLHVSDHGNMELYAIVDGANGKVWRSVWGCV